MIRIALDSPLKLCLFLPLRALRVRCGLPRACVCHARTSSTVSTARRCGHSVVCSAPQLSLGCSLGPSCFGLLRLLQVFRRAWSNAENQTINCNFLSSSVKSRATHQVGVRSLSNSVEMEILG